MKPIAALIGIGIVSMACGGEPTAFQTAKAPEIGQSSAFELTRSNRAVVKTEDHGFILLDLLESSVEDGGQTFTEACSIAWTRVTPKAVDAGTSRSFIRYRRSGETEDGATMVEKIGGSEKIQVGEIEIGWSCGSPDGIFLYPSPGIEYATVRIEEKTAGGTATDPESGEAIGIEELVDPERERIFAIWIDRLAHAQEALKDSLGNHLGTAGLQTTNLDAADREALGRLAIEQASIAAELKYLETALTGSLKAGDNERLERLAREIRKSGIGKDFEETRKQITGNRSAVAIRRATELAARIRGWADIPEDRTNPPENPPENGE